MELHLLEIKSNQILYLYSLSEPKCDVSRINWAIWNSNRDVLTHNSSNLMMSHSTVTLYTSESQCQWWRSMSSGQEKRHKNLMPLSSRGKRVRGYEGLKEKKIVNARPASSEGEQLLQKGTVFDSEDGSSSHKIFHNSSSMSTINSLKYSHFKYAIGQAIAIISSERKGHAT